MKTIMIAVLLVGCIVLAAADDYSKDTPTFPINSCTDTNGEIYPDGYSGPVIGQCQQITCKHGQLHTLGCPTVFDANKNLVPETSGLLYPDCCPSQNPGNK